MDAILRRVMPRRHLGRPHKRRVAQAVAAFLARETAEEQATLFADISRRNDRPGRPRVTSTQSSVVKAFDNLKACDAFARNRLAKRSTRLTTALKLERN